jgi:transglutaminase-like putative cysteine protease
MKTSHFCGLLLAAWAGLCGPAQGGETFPPITDTERALKSVQEAPNAPGVVLFRNGEFHMRDFSKGDPSSRLTIHGRIKILTEGGKRLGEIEIPYSADVRLSGFEGRTVLPDGKLVPLPADAKFERRLSKTRKLYVSAVAFPAVQVGAILDYRFDLFFDSIYLLEPWYFSGELPTLHSEIVYLIPKPMAVQTWRRDPFALGIKLEKGNSILGVRVRAWADQLPPVPDELYQLPLRDLAAQIVLLPTRWTDEFESLKLMESWAATSELLLDFYDDAIRKDGNASSKAKELARTGKTARERAAALYRFVRDQIETEERDNVVPVEGRNAGSTLAKGRGDSADKSLLLIAMLGAVKIPARPVWAAERGRGLVDPALANPEWFNRVLVAAELDGQRVLLDPSDRALGFGQLDAHFEGTFVLLPDKKKPEAQVLPETPFDQSRRQATLKLAIDDKGVVTGTGTLLLTGHHSTERIGWQENAEKTASAWKDWLAERHKEFAISDVKVAESPEDRKVEVSWTLAQREEEALGDELSLSPSRPLGPAAQPFPLGMATRRSPILFDYGDRDDVELELRWPEGWKVEAQPHEAHFETAGLAFSAEVAVKPEEHTLSYKRRLDVGKKLFATREECEAVRALYEAAAKSDAEALVLAHR